MDRREFFMRAGAVGITAAISGQTPQIAASSLGSADGTTDMPMDDGVQCLPDESGMMRGFPPPQDKQVTRENREESQAKLRWASQHWRELFPTQRVARSSAPTVLPRATRNIRTLAFADTTGQPTTVAQQLDRLHVNAFIVLKDGKIAFEEYRHGMRPDTPHFTFSVYKSIVATVIAALTDEGERLEDDQTIESYVPELVGTAFEGAMVRQLLDMESGIKFEYTGANCEMSRYFQSIGPDARAVGAAVGSLDFLLTLKKERNHGERMAYKEADLLALAWAAEKKTHMRFADLLSERIWAKIGAEFDADAVCDPLCQWSGCLSVALRDLARWGLMCLNDGMVDGKPVIPARFFSDIRENASVRRLREMPLLALLMPEGVGYRSFFYHHKSSGAIAAVGAAGQFCYINRKHKTVVAFFSTTPLVDLVNAQPKDLEEGLERASRDERERWLLCHEIAQASA